MSCIVATNATCKIQLVLHFYDELQVVIAIGKCHRNPNCNIPIFFTMCV